MSCRLCHHHPLFKILAAAVASAVQKPPATPHIANQRSPSILPHKQLRQCLSISSRCPHVKRFVESAQVSTQVSERPPKTLQSTIAQRPTPRVSMSTGHHGARGRHGRQHRKPMATSASASKRDFSNKTDGWADLPSRIRMGRSKHEPRQHHQHQQQQPINASLPSPICRNSPSS